MLCNIVLQCVRLKLCIKACNRQATLCVVNTYRITLEQYNKNNERYAEELAEIQMREDQSDNADQNFYTTAGYLLAMFESSERLFEVASIDEK